MREDYLMFSVPLTITRYIVLFFAVMAGIMFCYNVRVLTSIFCVTAVYAIQHLIYDFHQIVMAIFDLRQYSLQNNTSYILYVISYFLIVSILYVLIYYFYIKKFIKPEEKHFQNRIVLVLCIFVNLYATVFSIIFRITQENAQFEIFLICVLLDIMCCLFTMYLLFYIFNTSVLQDELNIIKSILKKDKDQFKVSQANIELINIKCHDLKHQLTHLSSKINKSELEELNKVISIYDIPMTGNPVLDVVIAEKKLQCEREEIEFTCMVDGEKLGFMKETDIYSLFGNALDNAINSVRKINEKDQRVVSLIIKDTMGLISIHFENYFQGELLFENGLPVTTNKDKDYHGFGMKSMKYLVEKYGGELSIKIDENVFNVNIVFQSQ
ncbi:ATP-binding protein [Litchfieldia salsa]|nr:ATP-binding protein [Litchfieldia salsa]